MGKITAQPVWLLCLCWPPGLYLSIPIKAVRNETWEWSGLRWSVCVCVRTEEVAFLLKQLSVCLRAALVRAVTHSGIIIGCVTSITQTVSFPRYVGWCHLVYHFFFIHTYLFIILFLLTKRQENPSPWEISSKIHTHKKSHKKIKTTHPIDLAPRHMDIPCLSSIKNNFGKLWINTFPVTCWRGEGQSAWPF